MEYSKYNNGKQDFWIANPKNWEELSWSIHNEPSILYYDPNLKEPEKEQPLLNDLFKTQL
jgi:hypothetical protein